MLLLAIVLAGYSACADHPTASGPSPGRATLTIALGQRHSCALDAQGTAYCWGQNVYGQLGLGQPDTADQLVPTPVSGERRFAAIATNDFHTCALTPEGEALCWGSNERGQLGAASTELCDPVYPTPCTGHPVPVAGGLRFTAIATGFDHTCALAADGSAYCWGSNASGALGIGDTSVTARDVPTRVATTVRFVAITAGSEHTCGLTAEGAALCWGDNFWGQLGTGEPSGNARREADYRATPRPVTGGHTFQTISAREAITCGVTRDGAAYCWGHSAKFFAGAAPPSDGVWADMESSTPLAVPGATGLASVAVGEMVSCGLLASGGLLCWGLDQLGILSPVPPTTLVPAVNAAPGATFGALAAGGAHFCGVARSGSLYCFGINGDGQLGDGTRQIRQLPVLVSTRSEAPRQ